MKVATTQPFELVYTLTEHAHLGYVIEPHVVQINSLGKYTLTHQRLFSTTAVDFEKAIDETDVQIIALLDELEQENIVKKFNPKKVKLRPADFFKKYCTEELLKEHIRPYIEERLDKVMPKLQGKPLFLMGKDKNPTSRRIILADESSTVLFHFRRNEEGTRYFPTIKYKGERIDFMRKDARIICDTPAWMLLGDKLLHFAGEVDGKKLAPFLNKHFIEIPKSAEPAYFRKFVVQLLEKFDVYAEGFSIVNETLAAAPVLKLEHGWNDFYFVVLSFKYGNNIFPYHSSKKVHVTLEERDGDFIFHKVKRSAQWEEHKRTIIETMGLSHYEGSAFMLEDPGNLPEGEQQKVEARYKLINWLNEQATTLAKAGFLVKQSQEGVQYFLGRQSLSFQVAQHLDWFDIMAMVTFGTTQVSFIKLRQNILQGKREFELPNGEIAIIPEEWFARYMGVMEFAEDEEHIRLRKHHRSLVDEIFGRQEKEPLPMDFKFTPDMLENVELPEDFRGSLRPYQQQGLNWFYFLKNNRFGGCLADDMGLGKTIQTLVLLQKEKELAAKQPVSFQQDIPATVPGPLNSDSPAIQLSMFNGHEQPVTDNAAVPSADKPMIAALPTSLIIVPTSLVFNWMNESAKFTPNLRVHRYTGVYRDKNIARFQQYDLIVTTYGVVRNDIDLLQQYPFHYIILDESQVIKNPLSQTARAIKNLQSQHKLVLTGTPIENTLIDLWSQMSFVNPGLLGNYTFFNEKYVLPIEKQKDQVRMGRLQQLIKPFVLRRTKEQVAPDLPEKYEQIYYCEMTEEQEKVYENTKSFYRNEILRSINEVGLKKSQLTILRGLTQLRQIANHPRLVDEAYIGESGKFTELIRMMETVVAEGHKVLLFSQFVKQLALFREYCGSKGIRYTYIDGSITAQQRQREVEIFQNDPGVQLFLISLKAGGTGLNLTAADYVFIVDPWWNPAIEKQAVDRSHRIGQTQNVFSYKFISRNTVEEKILKLQEKKLELAEGIITTEDSLFANLEIDEIEEMLN